MPRFNFSTGILSPINSDISLNDASIISSGSLPSSAPFDETETCAFESVNNDSKLDSFLKRNVKESTAVDMSNEKKKKNINVEKEVKFKESYEMLKHSMDELVYKYNPSSVLSPVSNEADADVEKVLEAKNFLQMSVLSPVSNDAIVEKATEEKNILPEKKNDKNAYVLKSKISKSGSAESKSSQHSNPKLQKKKDSNARNSKAIENNQLSKCTDPPQKSQKEILKKNLKRLELQPESKETAKLNSSVTELLKNPKESKKISSSTQSHEISAGSGSKEKENLKHFYTQKQKKSTVSSSQSITEIQNLSIEKSIEITMSMEMDRLRGFILDQNLSLRKELIKLHETVKRQDDVIGYLFSTIEDLKAENKKLVSKMN